jgi:hypothetical protein
MGGKRAKKKATLRGVAFVGLALKRAAWWLMIRVAVFLKRDYAFDVIGKRERFDKIATG